MTDTIRNLLISLSAHMAYMQGQLETHYEMEDKEDFYWYRESVLLRQKVRDALADEPAVPEGREPAAVTGQPSDEELLQIAAKELGYERIPFAAEGGAVPAYHYELLAFARAVLARWGTPNLAETRRSLGDGEVAELVEFLREQVHVCLQAPWTPGIKHFGRAAELLQRQALVPVSERLPGPADCDAEGECCCVPSPDDWLDDLATELENQ